MNMTTYRRLLPIALAAVFSFSCQKSSTIEQADDIPCLVGNGIRNGSLINNQYIVMYKAGMEAEAITGTLSTGSKTSMMLKRNGLSDLAVTGRFSGAKGGIIAKLSSGEANRLAADPMVEKIEQDRVVALGSCFTIAAPTLLTWNVRKTGFGDGTGKTAWIIDSGIESTHPDLNVDVTRSRSFVSGDASIEDENGHGTHVAGIIGAKNNTFGVLGVASNASLVSLKVLNGEGEGTLSSIIQALSYINSNAKAGDVVNISLGEEEGSDIFDRQVQLTAARGIFVTIAAGNESKAASDYSPGRANAPNIYTVSAVDSLNNFASFSNFGNDVVDFAAPGVHILSTFTNKRYAYLSGTSMAAPHVAGLLLLKGSSLQTAGYAGNDPDGVPDPIAMK